MTTCFSKSGLDARSHRRAVLKTINQADIQTLVNVLKEALLVNKDRHTPDGGDAVDK